MAAKERDSGLGVVYGDLHDQPPPPPRRSLRRFRRTGMLLAVLTTATTIAAPAVIFARLQQPPPSTGKAPVEIVAAAAPTRAKIGLADLKDLTLPSTPPGWTCPTTGVTVTDRGAPGAVRLTTIAHGDLDTDGTEDAVAVLRCVLKEQAGPELALALRRTPTAVAPIGVVAATGGISPDGRAAQWLAGVRIGGDGLVTIKTGDLQPYADQHADWTRFQDRTYGADGMPHEDYRFDPPVNPAERPRTDLRLRAGDLTFDADGGVEGTITLTVTNAGPVPADDVWVTIDPGFTGAGRGDGWGRCLEVTDLGCRIGDVAVGAEVTLLLVVMRPGPGAPTGRAEVHRRALGGAPVPDLDPSGDAVEVAVH